MNAEVASTSAALALITHTPPAALLAEPVRYVGRVKSVHGGGEYAFVDIHTVTTALGQPHDLNGTGDVYVHRSECGVTLAEGITLAFAIADDPKRKSCYRAVAASETFVPAGGPAAPTFRLVATEWGIDLARAKHVHALMPPVPAETMVLVRANRPFEGIPPDDAEVEIPDDPAALRAYFSNYLWTKYPGLSAIGVACAMDVTDLEAEARIVEETAKSYEGMGMAGQARTLRDAYAHLLPMRQMLQWILDEGLLQPGTKLSPEVLFTLLKLVEAAKTGIDRERLIGKVQAVIRFLSERDLLRPNTVLSDRFLPVLLAATPVVFWDNKPTDESNAWKADAANQSRCSGDWMPHYNSGPRRNVIDRLAKRPGQAFFHLFNMPGRQDDASISSLRTLADYAGENPPVELLQRITEARAVFDHIGIATSYLDQVLKETRRGVDPYVFGLIRGLPIVVILGRYSDSGLFPLLPELIGHTMEFLRTRTEEIRQALGFRDVPTDIKNTLQAFDAGKLFPYLRGE